MRNRNVVVFLILGLVMLSGCVSKKKFVDMEALKNRYLNQSNALLKENNNLKADLESAENDFEKMKQELHYSNAQNTDEIDQLKLEVKKLQENFTRAQSQLSKAKDLYKDQQYYSSQASNEITRLEFTIEQLKRDTVSLNYSLKMVRNKSNDLTERLSQRVDEINEKNLEISAHKETIKQKEDELAALNKQLVAEGIKINQISDEFIELRKSMLKAKMEGRTIDPNTDPFVDKISKTLGHY